MNTLAHLAATVALLWLAIYLMDTIGNTALGVAVLGGFLLFLALTILAFLDDAEALRGK